MILKSGKPISDKIMLMRKKAKAVGKP